MFVLAHLSDPHLGPLPRPRIRELSTKRALGYANWRMRRHRRHDPISLQLLLGDLATQHPDHVAVTGDLAVIGLASEFAPARLFLETIGSPETVSVVPGNHDAYVHSTAHHAMLHWSDYMRGDGERDEGAPHFPYVRRRGPVALIGLSSAIPTAPLSAAGRIGAPQAAALANLLANLGADGLFRVIMIHHPPSETGSYLRRLTDAWRLSEIVRRAGAELVLHGHNHRLQHTTLAGPHGPVPVFGVPSASATSADPHAPGAYNLYRIEPHNDGWRIDVETRGYGHRDAAIAIRHHQILETVDRRGPA